MNEKVFDEIFESERVDQIINDAIRKGRTRVLMNRFVTSITIISIFTAMVFGTCYASPTVAATLSKIPLVGSLFLSFTDDGLKKVSNKGLTSVTGLEVTNGDATIALKEIYYDKSQISFALAYKGISPYTSGGLIPLLYYKDTLISGSTNGGIIKASEDLFYSTASSVIPDNLPDKLDLKLIIQEQLGLKREFEFALNIDRTGLNSSTK